MDSMEWRSSETPEPLLDPPLRPRVTRYQHKVTSMCSVLQTTSKRHSHCSLYAGDDCYKQ